MNRFQLRAAQVPKPITWTILLSACAVAAYWWLAYSGLYRLLAEFQIARWNKYYPAHTGVFVLVLCLVPGTILVQIIGGLREKERSPQEAAAHAATVAARPDRLLFWLRYRRGRLTGLVITITLAAAGIYFLGSGLLAGDRVPVDAGALEHGEQPAGRYVEAAGQLVADDAVSVSEGGRSSSAKVYVPVVSPEWRGDRPVRLYLELSEPAVDLHAADLASRHYEGMLTANSLPRLVISSLADRAHPVPDRYWVLEYRETPAKKRQRGTFMLGAGAVAGLITAIGWARAARRERAAERPSA